MYLPGHSGLSSGTSVVVVVDWVVVVVGGCVGGGGSRLTGFLLGVLPPLPKIIIKLKFPSLSSRYRLCIN